MPGPPVTGRVFFEQVIRDNLDVGRPDQVSLIFGRRLMRTGPRATPGRFRARVITSGVTPSLHVDYKHAGSSSTTIISSLNWRVFSVQHERSHLPGWRLIRGYLLPCP